MLLCAVLVLCVMLSLPLLMPGEDMAFAEITSEGKLLRRVDLAIDQEFTVSTRDGGHNVVTVKNGKIGVTEANCPDHYCMDRGMISSGAQIVCLPNRLVITLTGEMEIDAIAG